MRQTNAQWRRTAIPRAFSIASASRPSGSYCFSPAELLRGERHNTQACQERRAPQRGVGVLGALQRKFPGAPEEDDPVGEDSAAGLEGLLDARLHSGRVRGREGVVLRGRRKRRAVGHFNYSGGATERSAREATARAALRALRGYPGLPCRTQRRGTRPC